MKTIQKKIRLLLTLSGILFLSSCTIKPLELTKINNVKVEPGNGFDVEVELTLFNPNGVKLAIDDIDIDVYLGALYLGKLEAPDITEIERKGEFTTSFKVQIQNQNMLVLGVKLLNLISKKQVDINLKGSLRLEHWLIKRKIQIDHTETIKL